MGKAEWFVDWFDSDYYHLLYNHRDHAEADAFVGRLCEHLSLPPGARIWDLACGKGRHSIALARRGFRVTGTDLSVNSIEAARAQQVFNAEFAVHDMREPFMQDHFDAVFNLFTSIGYFSDGSDNARVFGAVFSALRAGGVFVVDFFNPEKVRGEKPVTKRERRGEIVFDIGKEVKRDKVVKEIRFSDHGHDYTFTEEVSLIPLGDFEALAKRAGFATVTVFGDYLLAPYDPRRSDRMIMLFRKPPL